ncbi:MAG: histidinol-phosphate phosphatase family protein [Parcubacteria group bacterium Gr01-1014_70]|nr:MAG: histidinol-phosphate phosphatase family protein [Parcubacteria group bacterium Gr01-1014_70]
MNKAVILAGGKGARLGELTASLPKPLVEVGGKPVLEHQILLLKKYGITDIVLLTGHFGDQIARYVGDGSRWGVSATCMQEPEPQGTAGALRTLEGKIREDFLLLSGDVMTNVDISRFIQWHTAQGNSVATAIIRKTSTPRYSDIVEIGEQSRISRIFLRPHQEGAHPGTLGIASLYMCSPRIFEFIPSVGKCDIENDVFPEILRQGGELYGYHSKEYIRDMGTPDRLALVQADYERGVMYNTV